MPNVRKAMAIEISGKPIKAVGSSLRKALNKLIPNVSDLNEPAQSNAGSRSM